MKERPAEISAESIDETYMSCVALGHIVYKATYREHWGDQMICYFCEHCEYVLEAEEKDVGQAPVIADSHTS